MATFDIPMWVRCDSQTDMEARASGKKMLGTLLTSDSNTWGYFQTTNSWHLNIGYANIGLVPQAVLVGQCMLVGINECLVGYNLSIGKVCFSYRMPLIFHEFVEIGDPLIVRDEMGFVCLSLDGNEIWNFGTEGVVESYVFTSSKISGKTTEGSSFSFELPL